MAVQAMTASSTLGSMNFDLPEGLFEPYVEVFKTNLANARFRSHGEHLVPAQRGNLRTERITATMDAALVAACLNELADMLENDAALRQYLLSLAPQMMEGVQPAEAAALIGAGINGAAQGLRFVAESFAGSIDFSVYVATNGIAVRQALDINLGDLLGTNLQLNFDLLGRDFLINEMGFSLLGGMAGQTATLSYSQLGNNIMAGGIQEGTMVIRGEFADMFFEVTNDYFWDSNVSENNYRSDILVEAFAPTLGLTDALSFTILMDGSYSHSLDTNTLLMYVDVTGSWGELLGDPSASGRFVMSMMPIDASLISIPGFGVNLAEISADNEALIFEFMQLFQLFQ